MPCAPNVSEPGDAVTLVALQFTSVALQIISERCHALVEKFGPPDTCGGTCFRH
jgi:hypothetical protein